MNRKNKMISMAVVSSILASSGVAVMASNNLNTGSENDKEKSLLEITPFDKGNGFNLKLHNASTTKAFLLELSIEGDVEFNDNCFVRENGSNYIKTRTDVNKSGDLTTIKVAVTSSVDLSNSGQLNIGNIAVYKGEEGSQYQISGIKLEMISAKNTVEELSDIDVSRYEPIILKENVNNPGIDKPDPKPPVIKPEPNPEPEPSPEPNPGPGEKPEKPEPEKPSPDEKPENGGDSNGNGSNGESNIPSSNNIKVIRMEGKDRYETASKISKIGWKKGSKNVVIVNGNEKNMVDGLSATPFANAKNAPLLLSNNKILPSSTINELKRLKPDNVYVIGGNASIPESIVKSIKDYTDADVVRIGGSNRYETSLKIAEQLDKVVDVDEVYISSGNGEVDALSIASVAGKEKSPIILTNVNKLDDKSYNFIKSENVKNTYFIGGNKKISDSVIKQVDKIVSSDVSKNRIAGENRKDTNAKVLSNFYTNKLLNGVVVAKDDVLIDALAVGSFAAKNDMPVIIGKDSLSDAQKKVLDSKNTKKIYQSGGGVKENVISTIKELMKK